MTIFESLEHTPVWITPSKCLLNRGHLYLAWKGASGCSPSMNYILLLPIYLGYIISLANKSGSELATCVFVVVFLDRCDSTAKLKAQLNGLKSLTRDSATFKKIYRYAFDFCRVSLRFFFLSGVDLLRCCWSTCQHFAIFIGKYLLIRSVNKKKPLNFDIGY